MRGFPRQLIMHVERDSEPTAKDCLEIRIIVEAAIAQSRQDLPRCRTPAAIQPERYETGARRAVTVFQGCHLRRRRKLAVLAFQHGRVGCASKPGEWYALGRRRASHRELSHDDAGHDRPAFDVRAERRSIPRQFIPQRIVRRAHQSRRGDGSLKLEMIARQREGDSVAADAKALQWLERTIVVLQQDATGRAIEAEVASLPALRPADRQFPARLDRLAARRRRHEEEGTDRYLAGMAPKLTPRQQAQMGWLDTLPPKFEKMKKIIELFSTHHADETQVRALQRMTDELKAQASQVNITPLADSFGYMGMLLRRAGGHQTKSRGLAELLAGARINFEGACREASTPETPDVEEGEEVSP
jgi:hypothetical protein